MQAQTYMYAFLGSRPIGPLATFKNHMKILGPLPKPICRFCDGFQNHMKLLGPPPRPM